RLDPRALGPKLDVERRAQGQPPGVVRCDGHGAEGDHVVQGRHRAGALDVDAEVGGAGLEHGAC
ncbi:MAG: hypothetical protein ACK559_30470, partial [bacterium]